MLDRVREIPGVQTVSLAEFNALGRAWTHTIQLPGTPHDTMEATMSPVTPEYFETMRIPVLAGRTFVQAEMASPNATAIVVNATFASRYFGVEPAVGKTIDARFGENDAGRRPHEIVGVVGDVKHDLRLQAAPAIYIPLRTAGTVHVRAGGDAASVAARLRDAIGAANPLVRVTAITSQATIVDRTLVRERLLALLAGFFALVAVALAAVGLYGVLSFAVVRRTREIGIRVALGALHARVIASVMRDAALASLAGVVSGLAIAVYLSRFVETLLFEITPLDFWSLAAPLGALVVAGLLAMTVPAIRVIRVDPVVALRYE